MSVFPGAMAMPIPGNLSFEEAAAIAEVFLTAYQALFWIGKIQSGDTILIHAGASGVGTAAIQLVKEAGGRSIITAGSEKKLAFCQELGANVALNYKEGEFAPKVLEASNQMGVDIVLDFVGGPRTGSRILRYWRQMRVGVLIALLGGAKVEQVNLGILLKKRIQLSATTLRARSQDYKVCLTRDFSEFALERFADGRLKPIVDRVFPWEEVAEAHRYMEANKNIGKIVLNGM